MEILGTAAKGILRVIVVVTGLSVCGLSSSCMTAFDAHGRPIQVVDPAVAAAGMVAAGAVGYAVAQEVDDNDDYHHGGGYFYAGGILPYVRPLLNSMYSQPYQPPGYGYGRRHGPRCRY